MERNRNYTKEGLPVVTQEIYSRHLNSIDESQFREQLTQIGRENPLMIRYFNDRLKAIPLEFKGDAMVSMVSTYQILKEQSAQNLQDDSNPDGSRE